ncbi:retrovirus-related Pol polyprotein from transposon 412 [Trichonephila clavipes]|nr:retrovirus-related Pol polyprotein from transposon 412 [Trichonephila clavipes]
MTWKFATEKDQHMGMQTTFREDPFLRAALFEHRKVMWRNRYNSPPSHSAINIGIGPVEWQLIIPKTRLSTVLKELHRSPTGVLFGVMNTLQKVRERFYWNNMWTDVEKYCRICDPCAARIGPRKHTRGRLQLYNVGAPFEQTAFDILVPLPRSTDGNNNILVVMDYFTKWPEAYPI